MLGQEGTSPEDLARRAEGCAGLIRGLYRRMAGLFARGQSSHCLSLTDASQKLQKLAGDQSPLLELFCLAAQNTALDQAEVAKGFQAVQRWSRPTARDSTRVLPTRLTSRALAISKAAWTAPATAPPSEVIPPRPSA